MTHIEKLSTAQDVRQYLAEELDSLRKNLFHYRSINAVTHAVQADIEVKFLAGALEAIDQRMGG